MTASTPPAIETLTNVLDRLVVHGIFGSNEHIVNEGRAALSTIETDLRRKDEALRRYGKHDDNCHWWRGHEWVNDCSCGLTEARALLTPVSPSEPVPQPEHVETYWLIHFEDADRVDEVFTDGVAARERSRQVGESWNHTLFRSEPVPQHPCPKGDGCALNRGAVHCKHCGRNWPPDETWDTEPVPQQAEEGDPTGGLPLDLARVLRDQSVIVPQDAAVFEQIAKWAKAPSNTASASEQAEDVPS